MGQITCRDTPCSRIRDKPHDANCIWLTLLLCRLGNLKSKWGPPQQYLWGMGYPLLKCSSMSPANSAGCLLPNITASRFEISTLWPVHPGLSLVITLLPALLHLFPSWPLAYGKGLGSSYPSSQPYLRSRLGGTGCPCAVWLHDITPVSPCEDLSTHCHSGDTSHRDWCTSSLSVGVRQSAQIYRVPINQPQKAVTAGTSGELRFCSFLFPEPLGEPRPHHLCSHWRNKFLLLFPVLSFLFVLNKILHSSASP